MRRRAVDEQDLDTLGSDAKFIETAGCTDSAPETGEAAAKHKNALHCEASILSGGGWPERDASGIGNGIDGMALIQEIRTRLARRSEAPRRG